jgi:hypothetical protein
MRDELAKSRRYTGLGKYPLKVGMFPRVEEKAQQRKAMMKDMTTS